MINKPLIIVLFMYSISVSLLVGQFIIADVFGITLTNFRGSEIKNSLADAINIGTVNIVTANFTDTNYTVIDVAAAFLKASGVLIQLLLILSGTYFFYILWFLIGADQSAYLIVGGMASLYAIMLGNTLIAKIRGL